MPVFGIEQSGSILLPFVLSSVPWLSDGPSSSTTSFYNVFLDSGVKHPYYMPSPLLTFNAHVSHGTISVFLYSLYSSSFSVISSDLKHRANDARDALSSYSSRRDQSGLNGCCTAMWKANGKTTTLSLFLDSLFPKTEIPYIDLKDRRGYCQLKEEALDRTVWRNRFGRGFGPVF